MHQPMPPPCCDQPDRQTGQSKQRRRNSPCEVLSASQKAEPPFAVRRSAKIRRSAVHILNTELMQPDVCLIQPSPAPDTTSRGVPTVTLLLQNASTLANTCILQACHALSRDKLERTVAGLFPWPSHSANSRPKEDTSGGPSASGARSLWGPSISGT
jgi:hypothetical protein